MSFDILLNVDPEKEEKIKSSFGIEIVTKGSPELTVFLDIKQNFQLLQAVQAIKIPGQLRFENSIILKNVELSTIWRNLQNFELFNLFTIMTGYKIGSETETSETKWEPGMMVATRSDGLAGFTGIEEGRSTLRYEISISRDVEEYFSALVGPDDSQFHAMATKIILLVTSPFSVPFLPAPRLQTLLMNSASNSKSRSRRQSKALALETDVQFRFTTPTVDRGLHLMENFEIRKNRFDGHLELGLLLLLLSEINSESNWLLI